MPKLVIAGALVAGCLSVSVQSQIARPVLREEAPPDLILRIDGRAASGAGELQVALDPAAPPLSSGERVAALVLTSATKQRVEIRGIGPLLSSRLVTRLRGDAQPPVLRLRYEQRIQPDGRRVFLALRPRSETEPALLVHLDLGGKKPIRQELLPGLTLIQRDEPRGKPDVAGAAARRTWLTVVVQGAESQVTLQGGDTRTISFRGASYQLHVYRSLRRDPGTDRTLPFEGERYLLSATLTPQ